MRLQRVGINWVTNTFLSHKHAVLTRLTLATQSPVQERQNWYSTAWGLKHTKQSLQVTHSKGSEIISQEMVKGQSWTLASQGPRPYFECAGFEQTIPAKPLLRTQVFPLWSSFHLLSGLCCTSMCCFWSDLLDLGFAFRSPHQNHWIITLEVQCMTFYSEILP